MKFVKNYIPLEQKSKKKAGCLKQLMYAILIVFILGIVVIAIILFSLKGPEDVVKEFNKAIISRNYIEAAKLSVIYKDGEYIVDDLYVETKLLKGLSDYQSNIVIDKILRVERGYDGTYVFARADNNTVKIAVKQITENANVSRGGVRGEYEVVVFYKHFWEVFYILPSR